jgi:periplasmic copper chaperone A
MRMFFVRCLAMLAAILCSAQVALASDIMVMNAVARASLTPTAKSGAIYLSIMNHGSSDDKLLSIMTSASTSAELHETIMDGDIMKMRAVESATTIAAGSTFEMKPGGFHIMLTGLKAPLKKGDVVAVTFVFEKAGTLSVDVPVGTVAASHEHGD